ncbi:MAG: serine hydrolase [Ruminococcaceae bacterium]|nr:serine hydrolase [Oscillospiraceae bacterium]
MAKKKNLLLNPQKMDQNMPDAKTQDLFNLTARFFEQKGNFSMMIDTNSKRLPTDWYQFIKESGLFATLLTPAGYGDADARWDQWRVTAASELLGFYGLYQYNYQVSVLGVVPIWISKNEKQKKELAQQLKEGHVYAFGMSERDHGADLYSNEANIKPTGDGKYVANGSKYYIGNSSRAPKISVFGRNADTDEFAMWVVDCRDRHVKYCGDIEVAGMFHGQLGHFEMIEYPLTADDILEMGDAAFAMGLSAVNVGKTQTSIKNVGMATHMLYEAVNHSHNRYLYGNRVTDMPHIRRALLEAWCRILMARLYAYRATDYFRVADKHTDRRYLCFNPIQKARTSAESERAVILMHNVMAAKAYETDTFAETAIRHIGNAVKLEGTAHINMGQAVKFMPNYFANHVDLPPVAAGNTYIKDDSSAILDQGFGKAREVRFADYRKAFEGCTLPNVQTFLRQAETLAQFDKNCPMSKEQTKNADFFLNIAEIFAAVVYGQLAFEKARLEGIEDNVIDQMFSYLVRDINFYALKQLNDYAGHFEPGQEDALRAIYDGPERRFCPGRGLAGRLCVRAGRRIQKRAGRGDRRVRLPYQILFPPGTPCIGRTLRCGGKWAGCGLVSPGAQWNRKNHRTCGDFFIGTKQREMPGRAPPTCRHRTYAFGNCPPATPYGMMTAKPYSEEGCGRMFEFPRATPAEMGVDPAAIQRFAERFEQMNGHAFMVLRHGHCIAEGAVKPYKLENPHPVFSVTKSFTGMAVGFALQEGLLALDEPVAEAFPELLPAAPCENMRKMQLRHLLTMTTGHASGDTATFDPSQNWLQNFMQSYITHPPGTVYTYNNGASNVLAALVQKRSGQKMAAYLKPRLLDPLGIDASDWMEMPGGITTGAYGLNLRAGHLARFGQFLLQKGNWQGTQLLDASWIEAATSRQVPSDYGATPAPQYEAGYGYQFWRCTDGASYRAAGLLGQNCTVLPRQDTVVVTLAGHCFDYLMPDMLFETLVPGLLPDALPPHAAAQQQLEARLAALAIPPLTANEPPPAGAQQFSGRHYRVTPSKIGITGFALTLGANGEDTFTLHSKGASGSAIIGKNGHWAESHSFMAHSRTYPSVPAFTPDVACTGGWQNGVYHMRMVSTHSVFLDDYEIHFGSGGALLKMRRTPRMGAETPQPGERDYTDYQFFGASLDT